MDRPADSTVTRRRLLVGATACGAATFGSSLLGCSEPRTAEQSEPKSSSRADVPLRIVWVGQQSDCDQVQRVWQSMDPLPLSITCIPLDLTDVGDMSSKIQDVKNATGRCDLIVAPLMMVADLFADNAIAEIVGSEFERGGELDLLPAIRVGAASYAGRMMAIPIGSQPWALLASEQVEGLVDVQNWTDYDDLVALQNGKAAEPTLRGHCGYSFLLRASSVAQQGWLFDRETFAPTIARSEYVGALELMQRTVARYDADPMGPSEIGQGIANGDLQLGVGSIDASNVETVGLVAVTDLPKGLRVSETDEAGEQSPSTQRNRSLSPVLLPPMTVIGTVSKDCRQTRSAKRWLAWLNNGDGMGEVWRSSSSLSPTSSKDSGDDLSSAMVDTGYQDWVQRHFSRSAVRPVMQLISGASYYDVLDKSVHSCLYEGTDAKVALDEVVRRWSELTDSVGLERQERAWRRASGREV